MNKFADLTKEEFKAQYLGLKQELTETKNEMAQLPLTMPAEVDWRGK